MSLSIEPIANVNKCAFVMSTHSSDSEGSFDNNDILSLSVLSCSNLCSCTQWLRDFSSSSCNLQTCAYVQNILDIRKLREQAFRTFDYHSSLYRIKFQLPQSLFTENYPVASNNSSDDATGHIIWGSSIYTIHFMLALSGLSNSLIFSNRGIIELGSGSGICSIIAALCMNSNNSPSKIISNSNHEATSQLKPFILATDQNTAYTQQNINYILNNYPQYEQQMQQIATATHSWGHNLSQLYQKLKHNNLDKHHGRNLIDIILLSDVLYFSACYEQLLCSLHFLLSTTIKQATNGQHSIRPLSNQITLHSRYNSAEFCNFEMNEADSQFHRHQAHNFPFIILSHKQRDIDTERPFFKLISEFCHIFQVDGSSCVEFAQLNSKYLDTSDPSLQLFILWPIVESANERNCGNNYDSKTNHEIHCLDYIKSHWFYRSVQDFLVERPANSFTID
jgi:predicted nicotinamide N-methyase